MEKKLNKYKIESEKTNDNEKEIIKKYGETAKEILKIIEKNKKDRGEER